MINKIFLVLIFFATSITSCKKKEIIVADADFQKKTMEALLKAKPDSTIELPEGKFQLDASLSLSVNNVKIKGQGMDKTILSFKGQSSGAEGLLVTADGFSIEDLSIEDTKGDALKIKGGNGITIRRVRTAWTGGPNEKNGAYGIYPVQCKNILIEDSVAIGASDSGIYVGQSSNIIVRRNKAEFNVAGIEIENSTFADVYENTATNNTGGILVFDLPDLPIQGGKNTRVFKNEIFNNNTDNFAPKGNIVGVVPPGTGLLVLANDNIEIFENTIKNHDTVNIGIVSYFVTDKPINDPKYDPYPESIYIHDNKISEGGENPRGVFYHQPGRHSARPGN
jgi:parallel beta-helix repeat protein